MGETLEDASISEFGEKSFNRQFCNHQCFYQMLSAFTY